MTEAKASVFLYFDGGEKVDGEKSVASQMDKYTRFIEKQSGRSVRPYREDGFVNLLNKYGTVKDTTEHYHFEKEPNIPYETLEAFYEGNGLFAKIIDAPSEEAVKHGFTLDGIGNQEIEDFYIDALDTLNWEERAISGIKWARLFGGSIGVMLIDDGRGLEEPLDWKNIKSIDDIYVYDSSIITPDYASVYRYEPSDPFRARGRGIGIPERYLVTSKFGSFNVHESRCLIFRNGELPERTTNALYQIWGIPEYLRIHRAVRDADVAHGSAVKLLDRSVQAIYRMKDLASELATEDGEDRLLRRMETIDMARGLYNTITIDSDGEDYDFRTFQFSGVSNVVDSSCNLLSAVSHIPQTVLFGRSPAGMNATGRSDLENYYNYIERIQKRMLKSNLRYLLAVIFRAGLANGDIDEIPSIKIQFNPLWSLSEEEQTNLEQQKAQVQMTKANVARTYIEMQVLDPIEVRKELADSEEFDVDTMLDDYDEEELEETAPSNQQQGMEGMMPGMPGQEAGQEGGLPQMPMMHQEVPEKPQNEEKEEKVVVREEKKEKEEEKPEEENEDSEDDVPETSLESISMDKRRVRIKEVKNRLKVADNVAEAMLISVDNFIGNDYEKIQSVQRHMSPEKYEMIYGNDYLEVRVEADILEEFIKASPKWENGNLYHCIQMHEDEIDRFIEDAKMGRDFGFKATTSWSTRELIQNFDLKKEVVHENRTVIFVLSGAKSAVPVTYLFDTSLEEVLLSREAKMLTTKIYEMEKAIFVECKEI